VTLLNRIFELDDENDSYIGEYSENEFEFEHSILMATEVIEDLRKNGVFLKGDFYNDTWILENNKIIHQRVKFIFDDILDSDIKIKVKCWISNFLLHIRPFSACKYLRYLRKFLNITKNLTKRDIDAIDSSLNDLPATTQAVTLLCGINFLDYLSSSRSFASNIELFLINLRTLSNKFNYYGAPRDLPPYRDVVRFGFILSSFSKGWDPINEIKYLPILIWWKLTSVIPLRISELCSIKRDCLSVKGNNYFLKLPRQKQKASKKSLEVTDMIPISEEIYSLLKRYIFLSDSYGETNTLLSPAVYRNVTYFPHQVKVKSSNPKYYLHFMFSKLLNMFYSEVIVELYGLEPIKKYKYNIQQTNIRKMRNEEEFNEFISEKQIVQIQPNDTRHFAICNMMIQGFDPLTIARMAGHKHLESQYHYQKHIEYFVDSKAYEAILVNRLNSYDSESFPSTLTLKSLTTKSLAPKEMFEFLDEVDFGYCTDELKRCESRICILCSKNWIPREEIENNLREIIDMKQELKKKITIRSETLSRIYTEIIVEHKTSRINPMDQEDLSRAAKLTNGEIHDYAMFISKIFD